MRAVIVRERAAMAVLVLLLLLPVAGAALYLWSKHQWATDRLAEVEPRYARLLGLEASQAELAQAQRAAQTHLARFAYPASQDASQAGADAQQRVRSVATVAGLTLVSSQVLPAKAEGGFDRIPLAVRMEGEMSALQAVLVVLASEQPVIHFESMNLQTIGAVKAEVPARLGIQFNLFVLRKRQ
jgi:general secretion pathway protein M